MIETGYILTAIGIFFAAAIPLYIRHVNAKSETEKQAIRDRAELEKDQLRERMAAQQNVLDRLGNMERLYSDLKGQLAQAQPIYSALLEKAIAAMTHPSSEFHAADAILSKVLDGTITEKEKTEKLQPLLLRRAIDPNPKITNEERILAGVLPTLIVLADAEKAGAFDPTTKVLIIGNVLAEKEKEKKE